MRYLLLAVLFLGVAMQVVTMRSEDSKYQPTEIQNYRLQLRHKDATIAQKDLQMAQQNFAIAVKILNDEGDKVIVENKWPDEVKFDPDKISFSVPQTIKVTPEGVK